jgi:4-hydroxythreonine-4-phosphate dehydrogenase
MLRPIRIGITSGDAGGIGPEVVAKALKKIGPTKNVQFFLWRNSSFPKRDLLRISKSFKLITVESWAQALNRIPNSPREIVDICGSNNPAKWVEEAGLACYFKHLDALATGPLSKPSILAAGMADVGHTDILKRVSQTKQAYMTFIGENFNVMLLTGHLPLKDVAAKITEQDLSQGIHAATQFAKLLSQAYPKGNRRKDSLDKKPVGVLGLNPHAGDQGVIGTEEGSIILPTIEKLRKDKVLVEGPLVPDSAFTPDNWPRYSVYLAQYHDQGLIPFKTVHGQNGVHLTWGLPFVRTSVDHGTAFDIAGKDKADESSMRLAIELAIKLSTGRVMALKS